MIETNLDCRSRDSGAGKEREAKGRFYLRQALHCFWVGANAQLDVPALIV